LLDYFARCNFVLETDRFDIGGAGVACFWRK